MTLKQKLKDIDIGISELSEYLEISRPTLYKFIECYDQKKFKEISNKNILKLFNYIYENELVGKNNVINYILKNIIKINEGNEKIDGIWEIESFMKYNQKSKKAEFMTFIAKSNDFDEIIFFLDNIKKIRSKLKLSKTEKKKYEIYENLLKKIMEVEHE